MDTHEIMGLQTKPAARSASVGQVVAVPVHDSAASQGPAAARHEVAALAKIGAQLAVAPSQTSATSQMPLAAAQTLPADRNASAGHAAAVPVQDSAMSHVPIEG